MSQHMDHGETNRSSSSSSYTGYEGIPKDSYNDYPSNTFGQKLTGQPTYEGPTLAPTFGQRLALAIVSLALLLVALIAALIGVASAGYNQGVLEFVAIIGFMLFFIAVIVINLMFNRRY